MSLSRPPVLLGFSKLKLKIDSLESTSFTLEKGTRSVSTLRQSRFLDDLSYTFSCSGINPKDICLLVFGTPCIKRPFTDGNSDSFSETYITCPGYIAKRLTKPPSICLFSLWTMGAMNTMCCSGSDSNSSCAHENTFDAIFSSPLKGATM
jgi:hypothetical protein